jgi:RHS repeat-associated protein
MLRTISNSFITHNRLGFQAQEMDDEIKGDGNSVNYKFRMHDPRLGRFFAVDPLASKYPYNSTYAFSENRVVDGVELEGLEYSPNELLRSGINIGKAYLSKVTVNTIKVIITKTLDVAFGYHPPRNNNGIPIINNNSQAIEHYYRGNGETVVLGQKTVEAIKDSDDVKKYREKIKNGKTNDPSKGSGLVVDMEEYGETFHLGKMELSYNSKLSDDGKKIITNFTVDDKGFVDPNSINIFSKDDNAGPNNELGGVAFDYKPVKWTEVNKNPGYKEDKTGKILPLKNEDKK